ncbi:MAG: hypothetical protein H6741_28635 [Alphaproteobacteria bacterium]|nr:hypothetical protein [Alphaproteobacteria bacterium]
MPAGSRTLVRQTFEEPRGARPTPWPRLLAEGEDLRRLEPHWFGFLQEVEALPQSSRGRWTPPRPGWSSCRGRASPRASR